jgi:CDP-paratose 2-epimerase
MDIVVTGSSGLIGSEAVEHLARQGHRIHGVDNNMRADFFGPQGDTTWRLKQLTKSPQSGGGHRPVQGAPLRRHHSLRGTAVP